MFYTFLITLALLIILIEVQTIIRLTAVEISTLAFILNIALSNFIDIFSNLRISCIGIRHRDAQFPYLFFNKQLNNKLILQ
jgi:hypothetical protein